MFNISVILFWVLLTPFLSQNFESKACIQNEFSSFQVIKPIKNTNQQTVIGVEENICLKLNSYE
ncbi:hypothetical protein KC799_22940 [candidate division KSB1 bacterium]|nr:hypothetical protein [candidate division KSB1 bacterium]